MKLGNHYRERFRRIKHAYKGGAVGFRCDQIILPDGHAAQREYLTHPGAVGVLAFTSKGELLLVKQYRYPVGRFTYEIPAGKLGKREDPDLCVRRELEEETGYRARSWKKLLYFWPTAAFANEVIHLYIARHLTATKMNPDEDEFIELVKMTPRQMERMIRSGKIHDSKTLIAFLAWKTLFKR